MADSSDPNWEAMVTGVLADDDSVIDLFDLAGTVSARFEKLTERVSTANGRLYFDGDEVDNGLAKQVIRFLDEDVSDWVPLVNFFEKVQANPNEHSREQLHRWLDRHDFTITHSGDIVGYKGVSGDLKSINSGPGIIDGVSMNGRLPNEPGSIIEIARSAVHHDPSVGCSTGLHVGTFGYASSFGQVCLEVHVNPRDVVSVPTDCNDQKVRCCRYTVVDRVESQYGEAVLGGFDWFEDDEEGDFEYECGCDPEDFCDC